MAAYLSSKEFREQQAQAWIRSGQTELGDAMQGEHSVESLADLVVGFLARYLGAHVGVIHKRHADGHVRRVGSYALAEATAPL